MTTIDFGIFDHIEINSGRTAGQLYEERIALIKRGEELGMYAYHLAEHHGQALSACPSAAVFLTALARETTTLRLIPTVVCLPLHYPVKLYEELAMLDVLSNGRLEIGVGKGITAFEHLQFAHRPEEAAARADDILKLLLRAWETGVMSSEGSEFFDFVEMKLPFETIQQPYPPLWTAGNIVAAGSRSHHVVYPTEMPADLRARYDELRAASGQEPGHQSSLVTEPKIAQSQSVVIARTDEEAEEIGRRAWGRYIEVMQRARGEVPPHLQTDIPEFDNPFAKQMLLGDPIEKGMLVTGGVEKVRDYYVECAQRGTANYYMLMIPFGDMSFDEASYTLEAFASEVMPAVREASSAVVA
jgi:alkanesulfonate monooxygenase SsuD/methylene tetrahydromethanopterin reductase-like flavin-dependent oxidoreductase (luciferase family)